MRDARVRDREMKYMVRRETDLSSLDDGVENIVE